MHVLNHTCEQTVENKQLEQRQHRGICSLFLLSQPSHIQVFLYTTVNFHCNPRRISHVTYINITGTWLLSSHLQNRDSLISSVYKKNIMYTAWKKLNIWSIKSIDDRTVFKISKDIKTCLRATKKSYNTMYKLTQSACVCVCWEQN